MLAVTITSNLNASMIGVIFDTTEMEAGNLPRQSLIRADKVHNLRQASIIKTFGVLRVCIKTLSRRLKPRQQVHKTGLRRFRQPFGMGPSLRRQTSCFCCRDFNRLVCFLYTL